MKKISILSLLFCATAQAECVSGYTFVSHAIGCVKSTNMCDVILENKQTRVSLDLWAHVSDSMGAVTIQSILPAAKAVEGSVLQSSSNAMKSFLKGSFNPTKKSVTTVKRVLSCDKD